MKTSKVSTASSCEALITKLSIWSLDPKRSALQVKASVVSIATGVLPWSTQDLWREGSSAFGLDKTWGSLEANLTPRCDFVSSGVAGCVVFCFFSTIEMAGDGHLRLFSWEPCAGCCFFCGSSGHFGALGVAGGQKFQLIKSSRETSRTRLDALSVPVYLGYLQPRFRSPSQSGSDFHRLR